MPSQRSPRRKSQAVAAFLSWLRAILKPRRASTRVRRYGFLAGGLLALIWCAVVAYSVLSPKVYTSEMTLILPGARSSSVFSLDNIGQANTQSDSPFSSITSTPKVIYQSIALSDEVLGRVAHKLSIDPASLTKPRIELIDETSLMIFKVYSNTAASAQQRAQTLLDVFLGKLDELRRDEVDRRAQSIKDGLSDVEANLKKARANILAFQQGSSVVTSDQIKSIANQVEELRGKISQTEADAERAKGERDRLSQILDIDPEEAAAALQFQDDPGSAALLKERTDALTLLSTNAGRWGPNNPSALSARARFAAADKAVSSLADRLTGGAISVSSQHFLTTSKDRSELYRRLVELDSQSKGLEANLRALKVSLHANEDDLEARSASAAQLADLERDHKIAEAVFSSALARVDSGREDIFGSYPLVQIVAVPTLPEKPSSPQPKVAAIGGAVATLLVLFSLWLAWVRQPFLTRHLGSSARDAQAAVLS